MFWLHDFLDQKVVFSDSKCSKENWELLASIIHEWNNSEQISFQTSGSTGTPSKVTFLKSSVIESCLQTQRAFSLNNSTSCLCCLHLQYVAGKMMVLRALACQLPLFICEPNNLNTAVAAHSFSFVPLVPLQIPHIPKENLPKQILLGGSAVDKDTVNTIQSFPKEMAVWQGYGMTETLTHIALRNIHPNVEAGYAPLPGITITTGEKGNAEISAGYLPDKVITNDLIEFTSNDRFVISGRTDWIINSGGHKINPVEIEQLLKPLISSPFFIHGIPEEKLGTKAVLVVEGNHDISITEVQAYLRDKTHKYNMPKTMLTVPRFTRSAGGKILRLQSLPRN